MRRSSARQTRTGSQGDEGRARVAKSLWPLPLPTDAQVAAEVSGGDSAANGISGTPASQMMSRRQRDETRESGRDGGDDWQAGRDASRRCRRRVGAIEQSALNEWTVRLLRTVRVSLLRRAAQRARCTHSHRLAVPRPHPSLSSSSPPTSSSSSVPSRQRLLALWSF